MAASKEMGAEAVVELQGEAAVRDAVGGLQGRFEDEICVEEAEEGRVAAVVEAEAADEAGIETRWC